MTLELTLLVIGVVAVISWLILKNEEKTFNSEPEKSDPPTLVVTDEGVPEKSDPPTLVVTDEGVMEVPAAAPAKMTVKKKTTTKKAKVDLDGMSKNDLLAHAKENGVKANASMNKAAILEAIKNG